MQIFYTEYSCECGVVVRSIRPVDFDISCKFKLPCPECGKSLYLSSVSRMESQGVEDEEVENG